MMETEDTMDTEKKVYNTPELVEHGTLSAATQGAGNRIPFDLHPADPMDEFSGGAA